MKSHLRITTALAAALTTGAALGAAVTSRADDPSPLQQANNVSGAARVGCLHFHGGQNASYTLDPLPNPRLRHPTYTFRTGSVPISVADTGDAQDGVTQPTASCPGVIYELRVVSTDGSSLELKSVKASATASGSASVSNNGSEVDLDWIGDGQTTSFSASVTTGWKYSPTTMCVNTYFHVLVAGQELTEPTGGARHVVCDDPNSAGEVSYIG